MCNNEDITSNPPIGVARLVTAPLVVMAAVPHPEPLPIIPLERYNQMKTKNLRILKLQQK